MFDAVKKWWLGPVTSDDEPVEASSAGVAIQVDRPIARKADDIFDRAPFAEQIAHIVASRSDTSSLVVGLYGPWGDGKTSTLAMIKETLEADADVITMDYNPWFYGDTTEQLTRSFFTSIKAKLETSGYFTKENIGSLMATFGAGVPYVGEGISRVGEVMTTEALTEARDALGEILKKHGKKIVIFIDDIDRLDRADIQTLFKLVRLSGGFDHTTYVLAFDDAIVAEALGQAYGAGDPVAGRRFLEKIVQVPLHLPPVRPVKLRDLMFAACDRILADNDIAYDEGQGSELGYALATGLVHALKTPRQVKLFDNAISFAVPLLKGEVDIVDQVQMEALRIFYPPVYEAVRKNPDALLRSRERRDGEAPSPIEAAIAAIEGSDAERKAVRRMLTGLFPRFGTMGHGDSWEIEWAKHKKICSSDYFARYFTYSVPADDISDIAIDELIARADDGDEAEVSAILSDGFGRGAAELLLRKLRGREDSMPIAATQPLVMAICRNASAIPISRDLWTGDFEVRQAARLVAHLCARAEPEAQDAALAGAIQESDSLFFAAQILRVSLRDPEGEQDRVSLPPDRTEPLSSSLFERLKASAEAGNPLEGGDDRLANIVYAINLGASAADKQALREWLASIVDSDSANAVRFLKAFAGRSQGSDGVMHVGDLRRDAYRGIISVIDPEILYRHLIAEFGNDVAEAGWRDRDTDPHDVDRRIATQFVYIHLHPIQEEENEKQD